jgi:hypothetical protein
MCEFNPARLDYPSSVCHSGARCRKPDEEEEPRHPSKAVKTYRRDSKSVFGIIVRDIVQYRATLVTPDLGFFGGCGGGGGPATSPKA